MAETLRAALVGCGRMGGTIDDEVAGYPAVVLPYSHAATYAACDGVTLAAIADVDAARRASFGDRWGIPQAHRYGSYQEMIERERPDLVSITTPATSHAEVAIFAAEHGVRGIWCEKAMAGSLAECDAMVEAIERHGARFNIGASRRYDPGVARVCQMLAAGELGRLRAVIAYGGGSLLHTGSHYWDLILRLAGDGPVEWVQGSVEAGDRWDGVSTHIAQDLPGSGQCRFATGVMGYFLAGGLPGEFEVIAAEGLVRIRNNGVDWELWRRGPREGWDRPAFVPAPFPAPERVSKSLRLLEDLRDAVLQGCDTLGNARIARAGTELCLGVVESHRQGGARVSLPMANRTLYMASR